MHAHIDFSPPNFIAAPTPLTTVEEQLHHWRSVTAGWPLPVNMWVYLSCQNLWTTSTPPVPLLSMQLSLTANSWFYMDRFITWSQCTANCGVNHFHVSSNIAVIHFRSCRECWTKWSGCWASWSCIIVTTINALCPDIIILYMHVIELASYLQIVI